MLSKEKVEALTEEEKRYLSSVEHCLFKYYCNIGPYLELIDEGDIKLAVACKTDVHTFTDKLICRR